MTKLGPLLFVVLIAASTVVSVQGTAVAVAAPQALGRTVLVGGDPAHRRKYQRWIDAARFNVKQVAAFVSLREGNCPGTSNGLTACVIDSPVPGNKTRLYIPSALLNARDYDPADVRNTVLHELGHIYDFKYNADRHRGMWMKLFGIVGPFYSNDPKPPYERFAVSYSYCAEGLTYDKALTRFQYDVYEYRFTREQYDATCALLRPPPPALKPQIPRR